MCVLSVGVMCVLPPVLSVGGHVCATPVLSVGVMCVCYYPIFPVGGLLE